MGSDLTSTTSSKKILRGTAFTFICVIIVGLSSFFTRKYVNQELDIEAYGFFYSLFYFFTLFIALFDMGVGHAGTILLSRDHARQDEDSINKTYSALFVFRVLAGVFAMLLALALSGFLIESFFEFPSGRQAFMIMSVWMCVFIVMGTYISSLKGLKDFLGFNFVSMPYYLGPLLLILLLNLCSVPLSLNYIALFFLLSSIGGLTIGMMRTRNVHKLKVNIDASELKKNISGLCTFSRWIAVSTAALAIIFIMDTLMLTYYSSMKSVGEYNIAIPVYQISLGLSLVLFNVYGPVFVEDYTLKNFDRLKKMLAGTHILLFAAITAMCAFLYWQGQPFIELVFGVNSERIVLATIFLTANVPFLVGGRFIMSILNTAEKSFSAMIVVVIGLIINIVMNIILIREYDIIGAAFATFLSYFFVYFGVLILLVKLYRTEHLSK